MHMLLWKYWSVLKHVNMPNFSWKIKEGFTKGEPSWTLEYLNKTGSLPGRQVERESEQLLLWTKERMADGAGHTKFLNKRGDGWEGRDWGLYCDSPGRIDPEISEDKKRGWCRSKRCLEGWMNVLGGRLKTGGQNKGDAHVFRLGAEREVLMWLSRWEHKVGTDTTFKAPECGLHWIANSGMIIETMGWIFTSRDGLLEWEHICG